MQHHMILGVCKGGGAEEQNQYVRSLLSSASRFDQVVKELGGMRMNCKVGLQGITGRRLCGRKILVAVHSLEAIISFESKLFSLVSFRK